MQKYANVRAFVEDSMGQNEMQGQREPIQIRNRDIPLLSRVLYVMQAVSSTEQKRMWLQDRPGEPKGLDAPFAAIGETEERYEQECAEYMAELYRAEEILNAIPSDTMRVFVTMRYLLDMSRKEIMGRLNLKRWRYEEMCESIEQADDMKSVVWKERYTIAE